MQHYSCACSLLVQKEFHVGLVVDLLDWNYFETLAHEGNANMSIEIIENIYFWVN